MRLEALRVQRGAGDDEETSALAGWMAMAVVVVTWGEQLLAMKWL